MFLKKWGNSNLYELHLLCEDANVNTDLHSFCDYTQTFKEQYVEILMSYVYLRKNITAFQILRLEEIIRQFKLTHIWAIALLEKCNRATHKELKDNLIAIINELDLKTNETLLIDAITIDELQIGFKSKTFNLPKYLSKDKSKIKEISENLKIIL